MAYGTRSTVALGMATLLLALAMVPLCPMAPASLKMDTGMLTASDCDSSAPAPAGSVKTCPLSDEERAPAAITANDVTPLATVVAVVGEPPAIGVGPAIHIQSAPGSGPVASLTPLRL